MKKSALIVITLFSILLAACSPAPVQPIQSPAPTLAAASTKAPAANPTMPPAAATLLPAQPTQPAPTATAAPSASNRPAVPAEFAAKVNPLTASASVISDGKAEYEASCTTCHGDKADGNGRNSSITPKPSNLLQSVNQVQQESADIQQAFLAGEEVELHQMMIKAEEAGISMDLLLEVRNRLVDGYNEIMKMPL